MVARDTSLIGAVHILRGKPRESEAIQLLERIAIVVQPVMRARAWHVPNLYEFFPENPNLLGLNINGGQAIRIRLRPAHAVDSFLPFEDLVGTMLHELVHIVQGPHDATFYKILDALTDELQAHLAKTNGLPFGFESFTGTGQRLGSAAISCVGPIRAKALKAAEARRKAHTLMAGGKQRLGSAEDEVWKIAKEVCTPRELAGMAALRRAQDAVWCGSGENAPIPGQPTKVNRTMSEASVRKEPVAVAARLTSHKDMKENTWTCSACTLINVANSTACECCLTMKSANAEQVKPLPREVNTWSCPRCTLENPILVGLCGACEHPRGVR